VPYLIDALKHESPSIRAYAALTLGQIGDKRSVLPLIPLVNDPDLEPQKYLCHALGHLGLTGVLDAEPKYRKLSGDAALMLTKSRNYELRSYAAEALRKMHYIPAIPVLLAMGEDPDPVHRTYAHEALAIITSQQFHWNNWKWQNWWLEMRGCSDPQGRVPDGPDVFHVVDTVHKTPAEREQERLNLQEQKRVGHVLTQEELYYYYPDPPPTRYKPMGTIYLPEEERGH
jgi:hypothetical protein